MRVLITGAGRAIGAATAAVLHERGCEVVATARDPELLAAVPATQRLVLDVTDAASVAACMAAAGPIDVLVNNAGIAESGPVETYPVGDRAALRRAGRPVVRRRRQAAGRRRWSWPRGGRRGRADPRDSQAAGRRGLRADHAHHPRPQLVIREAHLL